MHKKTIFFTVLLLMSHFITAQNTNSNDTVYKFDIDYSSPKKYYIAGINIEGAENYDKDVLMKFSGLNVGQLIEIPGNQITSSVKKFWGQAIFSDVKIYPEKATGDKIWLTIALKTRPKVSEINYNGLKKSEKEDIDKKIGLLKDKQITPDMSDRAQLVIKNYLDDKGYSNAEVKVYQQDDPAKKGYVIVDVDVNKKLKTKVHKIYINGNENLSFNQINAAMKNTNDGNIRNIFRSKKFIKDKYDEDKISLIDKYNDVGYRDAYIVSDSVVPYNDKSVDVHITVNEGKKYYFGNIDWVGNTVYPHQYLSALLNIKKGEIYNHKLLMDRLEQNENDAVAKLYRDKGYLFFHIIPVETSIDGDTINFEVQLYEGKQATINNVNISGNDRVYENVIRRELRTKPGQLYSQEDFIRSLRELSQMGHFDPEQLMKDAQEGGIVPDQENGTVDLNYKVSPKSSDQVQLSAGWGAAGLVGSLGLKFSNFAIQNLFNKEMYRIVPQGEGQTFSINATTNGSYYTSASLSFVEPWLGGKRPNSLQASLYYTSTSAMSDRYYNTLSSNYYSSYYGSSYGSYGNYSDYYATEVDKSKYLRTFGATLGYGIRLNWPDDYFTFYGELSYQRFMLNDWGSNSYLGLPFQTGVANNFSVNLTLGRNSTDNPLFTRSGSNISLSLQITPPYSVIRHALYGTDYSTLSDAERYKFLEYHKWKFSAKDFISLFPGKNKSPVLMTRAEFAYIGHFNENARTPFGTYSFGGDGMTSYTGYTTEYIPMRGYETGGLTPYEWGYNSAGVWTKIAQRAYVYNKYTLELRYPISLEQSATIWALAFVEAGNSFNKITDFNPFTLKRSAGVGVRIVLPMFGLMGIDWGYGFDPQVGASTPHGSQFHFILGQDL